jgi:hypothetical protein
MELCTKCRNIINPEEDKAYDENDNRICLECFFDPTDKIMICEAGEKPGLLN